MLSSLLLASWTCVALLARARSIDAAALHLGGFAATTRAVRPPSPLPEPWMRSTQGPPGAWGRIELVPIALELPEAYATLDRALAVQDRWRFAAMDRDAAVALMATSGFTAEQLAQIAAAPWQAEPGGASVDPPDALVLSLAPAVRAALYGRLMNDPANKSAIDPSWFRAGRVDFRLRGSGLSDASVALLKQLLYPGDADTLLFNDNKPALRAIADPDERMRFLMGVTRKRAVVARLLVDDATDAAALADYWGRGGRRADVLPLLNAMKFNAVAGVENPGRVNFAALLPPFVQERLYRHADPVQPAGREPDDCYWTAFNFFSGDVPDDRVHDMDYLAALLRRDYNPIEAPGQLGDVILLADANGDAIHAANYVAGDVVFTKNGMSGRQPWILSTLHDLTTQYGIKNPTLHVAYFRKR